jgi:hypothetical protein
VHDIHSALLTYSSVVVFTQYADTMDYVRERLIAAGYQRLCCYSGRGGEVYDAATKIWMQVTKAHIKTKFRSGEIEVLIGTDSMSEGLNLQTSGRLINYDMPWNLMRVEQRIGRIDRIGASYQDIRISNYFYADTVEEQVYRGIAEDYGDFTNIVGDAAPVLATVEKVIENLALTGHVTQDEIANEVESIRSQVEDIKNQPIHNAEIGLPGESRPAQEPPSLVGQVTPTDIEQVLRSNGLTRPWLEPDQERARVYRLVLPAAGPSRLSFTQAHGIAVIEDYLRPVGGTAVSVTFHRQTWDDSDDSDLVFLTYGTPELTSLLPPPADD